MQVRAAQPGCGNLEQDLIPCQIWHLRLRLPHLAVFGAFENCKAGHFSYSVFDAIWPKVAKI